MRISGLASGIDTESMVKELMQAQRIPLDKITQKKQYFEWQLNDFRSTNRDLKDFSTKLFDNMILSTKFNQKNISISAPDDIEIKSKGNTENFSGTIKVEQLAKNATFQSGKITGHETFKVEKESILKIKTADGKESEVTLKAEDDISAIVKKITEQTGVRAFYDSTSGKIGMSSKNSGNGAIEITSNDGGKILSDLSLVVLDKIPDPNDPMKKILPEGSASSVNGADAKLTYNGMEIIRSSNTFELDGMEITLKAAHNEDITFNATTDTDKVFDNVKQFVDDYNKLIEDLNKKIREPKYRSFQPLSTEQKADMKEKEIEQWEEKAKSGTLKNDPQLTSLLSTMRTALMGSVEGSDGPISLSSIGITTSNNYLEHGKLVIDETKLKAAISNNPADVQKLFSNENKDDASQNGLARKLRTAVDATQKTIQKSAGKIGDSTKAFDLGRALDDMNKQIERFEDRMKVVENRYWKQFTAMETAINRANSQSASLMNAFGGN